MNQPGSGASPARPALGEGNLTRVYKTLFSRLCGRVYHYDLAIAAAVILALGVLALVALWPRSASTAAAPQSISAAELETAQDRWVLVFVSGAVERPGIYRLLATQRVADAVVAAGGATGAADPSCMPNLAARVKDGKQIVIPFAGHCAKGRIPKIDINQASREQLLAVPGMDPSLADAIIAYRTALGGFQKLSELKSQLGVDAALYKQLAKGLTAS
jgi:competence protein ComEA